MKEFKEWVKDKVIAFTYIIKEGCWGECGGEYYYDSKDSILWMLKSEYNKLDNPKDCIGLWNEVPQQFEKYCNMFNEKTRIK